MSSVLRIWLGAHEDDPWNWMLSEAERGVASDDAEKAELSKRAFKTVCVIIPGQWVSSFQVDLPDMKRNDQLKAASYAVESKLGHPLEDQHVVLSKTSSDVLVITTLKLRAILSDLSQHGLTLDSIYADFDALSSFEESLSLSDRIVLPGQYTQDLNWPVESSAARRELDVFTALSDMNMARATNLCTGAFSKKWNVRGLNTYVSYRHLGIIAGLLFILGGIRLGQVAAHTQALNTQASSWEQESARLYASITGTPAPADPARAILAQMKTQPNMQGQLTAEFQALFEVLADVDGVTIDAVQYNASQDNLSLRFIYPNFETSSELEQIAQSKGFLFSAGGVREQGSQLVGNATFKRGELK